MLINVRRDGSLAVGEGSEVAQALDTSDPHAITHILRGHVSFEDGLTVRQLFKALRPWGSFFSSSAIMNFDEFCAGFDQTYLVEADSSVTPLRQIEIYPVFQMRRLEGGALTVGAYWDFCGRYEQPIDMGYGLVSDIVSLSFVDLKTYANLPLVLSNKSKVISKGFEIYERSRPLMPDAMPGIYSHIEIPPVFFDVIVMGFLDKLSFYGSPSDAAEVAEEIKVALDSIHAEEDVSSEDDIDMTSCELEIPLMQDAGNSFDDFCAELGITVDSERVNAVRQILDLLASLDVPSTHLSESLGLSDLGLSELANGITAHFSTGRLKEMAQIIERSTLDQRDYTISGSAPLS